MRKQIYKIFIPLCQNKKTNNNPIKTNENEIKFLVFYNIISPNQKKKKKQVGTGGMDSKVSAATWALDRGVSVVICNGTQDKAIKTIIGGRKVGTFFTETAAGGPTPVDTLAENGKAHF